MDTPQETPLGTPREACLNSSITLQQAQPQVIDGKQAPSLDITQLQHSDAPVEHHTSEEGISHFDDDDAQQSYLRTDKEVRESVGQGSMSALQASLPVGVSMTHYSSQ